MVSNIRKHKIRWAITLLFLALIVFACYRIVPIVGKYVVDARYQPAPEEIFSRYLTYSDDTELLGNASSIQAADLPMGQGVYIRFEVNEESVIRFLEHGQTNPNPYHYPYEIVSCQNFYEAYAEWADTEDVFPWWRPREVTSPVCYITRGCELFLLDKNSNLTYYYFFPDFLGRDFLCVENPPEKPG